MNDEERVKEWVRGKDKELSVLHGVNEHGKFFLSPDIKEQIINVFTSDSDLALIDRENQVHEYYGGWQEFIHRELDAFAELLLKRPMNLPQILRNTETELKEALSYYKNVIPLAGALKEMEK